MHLFGWQTEPELLKQVLKPFIHGQYQITSLASQEIYRGEVRAVRYFTTPSKRLYVYFNWLCVCRTVVDEWFVPQQEWVKVPRIIPNLQFIEFEYKEFYYQEKEDRVKLRNASKTDVCRFFKPTDPTTVFVGRGEFITNPKVSKEIAFDLIDSDLQLESKTA